MKKKVYYDDEVDALFLKLGEETPEGVNLDTTPDGKLVGIEILKVPQSHQCLLSLVRKFRCLNAIVVY